MNRVCHFEVPFDDKERMQNFYSEVFGWKFMDAPGDMPYLFAFSTEVDETMQPTEVGGINGGAYPRSDEGGSKTPVIVLEVEDCAAKMQQLEAAGGTNLMGPHQVGDMGIYAQVKDTEGNIIGLWQAISPQDS